MAKRRLAQLRLEALDRAKTNQSLSNYPAIYEGFMAKGIPEAEIKPRENVFTFQAWKALGRSVKRGEHGVKVVTFVETEGKIDPATGEQAQGHRFPRTTTVFHISQTEPTTDYRTPRRSAWASGHGRYPSVDPGPRDPGEDAVDRWNEVHGDRS